MVNDAEDGNSPIVWEMRQASCTEWQWGINWNEWYPVNLRGIPATATIALECRREDGASFRVWIEDFAGNSLECVAEKQVAGLPTGTWQVIKIPLPDLAGNGFAIDRVKQLKFQGVLPGMVEIKSIRIAEK
jgi:hypothetical protein